MHLRNIQDAEAMTTGTLASAAVTADQVIVTYTVPAGKKATLYFWSVFARLTTYAATATLFGPASLEINGVKKWTQDIFHAGAADQLGEDFPNGIPLNSGDVVRLVCTPSAITAFTWRGSLGILLGN